jgi:tRNA dimethylallyltransferase
LSSNTVWIVAGPTASGKSALAVALAKKYDGVVINADSMQIYAEIPVIAAQPSVVEQEDVPHMLYGYRSVTDHYSAADWAVAAVAAIEEVLAMGKQPILVGGSGLYLQTLTDGLSPMPEVSAAVRKHVCDLYDMLGPKGFHEALVKIDPVIAARLHPTDRQRCIRAREIYEVSKKPLSEWQAQPKEKVAPHLEFKTILLLPEREWLHERINRRFVGMVENGALNEARLVNALNVPDTTGMRAVGLQALRDTVEGRLTLEEAIEQGQTQTRQYAKRQYTWFRGQALPNTQVITEINEQMIEGLVL